MHGKQFSCLRKLDKSRGNSEIDDQQDDDSLYKASVKLPEAGQDDGKTTECMICGKLFPRGQIDLYRHATGKRHYYCIYLFKY